MLESDIIIKFTKGISISNYIIIRVVYQFEIVALTKH